MLYFIVFFSGAVLMALEMAGSRVLAPSFGNSIYVWGSLITVVMAALTLGYYLGGKISDRYPNQGIMSAILAIAGCLIGFLPLWVAPVYQYLTQFDTRTGSLLAAIIFFFVPSLLLAMISPFGIKLASRSLNTLGNTAGRLASISSAGSIVGTLATSFYLIPAMGVRNIIHTLGIILLGLAIVSVLGHLRLSRRKRGYARVFIVLILFLGILVMATIIWSSSTKSDISIKTASSPDFYGQLYERDTLYHRIIIDQSNNLRYLHFDNSLQSAIDLDKPKDMVFPYTSYLHLGVVAKPKPRQALFIGLGGGSAPTKFLDDYSSLTRVDVVEIDPEVINVAYKYFQLPKDLRLNVVAQDGRLFVEKKAQEILNGQSSPYDMVIIDAYYSDAIPYHLTTLEFLKSVQKVLSQDGVVVSNIIGAINGPKSRLLRSMARTFKEVFPQFYLFPVGGWSKPEDHYETNVILIATQTEKYLNKTSWRNKAERLSQEGVINEKVIDYVETLVVHPLIHKAKYLLDVPLLTDDYAPVDILQHISG